MMNCEHDWGLLAAVWGFGWGIGAYCWSYVLQFFGRNNHHRKSDGNGNNSAPLLEPEIDKPVRKP